MLDPTMMQANMQPTPAAVPTPASAGKDMRVPMSQLPHGVKEGDEVHLIVASVDPATQMAMLAPRPSDAPTDPNHDHMDEPSDDSESSDEAPEGPAMDTKTLLGPMNGLKNYLVQKSMDVPKNQGR